MSKPPEAPKTEGDYEPFEHREVKHPINNWETLFHIVKITFGTGILALPTAVSKSGWVLGIILTLVVGIINTYTMLLLVRSAYLLCKRFQIPSLTIGQVFGKAVECISPNKGVHGKRIAEAFFFLYLIGVTCAYVMFMADNLTTVINVHSDYKFTNRQTILMMVGFLALLNCIPTIKNLVPLSILGHILTIFVFATLWYYMFRDEFTIEDKNQVNISGLPHFYGMILFALLPIALIMTLENEMKTPASLLKLWGPIPQAMVVNTCVTCSMGVLGYLKYGDELKSSITRNMPEQDILAQIAIISYCICIAIDFVLNAYVFYDLIFIGWFGSLKCTEITILQYLFRICVAIIICIICIALPKFSLFINLTGAIAFGFLGLVIPPLTNIFVLWDPAGTCSQKTWLILKNIWMLIIALIGMIIGTTASVQDVIDYVRNE